MHKLEMISLIRTNVTVMSSFWGWIVTFMTTFSNNPVIMKPHISLSSLFWISKERLQFSDHRALQVLSIRINHQILSPFPVTSLHIIFLTIKLVQVSSTETIMLTIPLVFHYSPLIDRCANVLSCHILHCTCTQEVFTF